jgi:pyrimidine operon attenuation protein / uracil phosphoribosyltransferase
MKKIRTISEAAHLDLTIERLCYQLLEDYGDFSNTCLVGIQTGGVALAERLQQKMAQILSRPSVMKPKASRGGITLPLGKLDITFYRDDFRTSKKPLAANANDMPFVVENQRVILVDDVLYTGRSVQAAMTALNHYGRPESVKLLVLVDRRFNRQVPVQPDYVGIVMDALDEAYVQVEWQEVEGTDRVLLFSHKE